MLLALKETQQLTAPCAIELEKNFNSKLDHSVPQQSIKLKNTSNVFFHNKQKNSLKFRITKVMQHYCTDVSNSRVLIKSHYCFITVEFMSEKKILMVWNNMKCLKLKRVNFCLQNYALLDGFFFFIRHVLCIVFLLVLVFLL